MAADTLVIYDSEFGNTAKIAKAIAKGLNARAVMAEDTPAESLRGLKLLVFGSPTQAGTMTQYLQQYCKDMPKGLLKGVRVASFDTRLLESDQKKALQLLMRIIGYAAPKIAAQLKTKGGIVVGEPMGFIVGDKEGPLKSGELERAQAWGKSLLAA
jgi:flavodoxin